MTSAAVAAEPSEEWVNRVTVTAAVVATGEVDAEEQPYVALTLDSLEKFCRRLRSLDVGGHQQVSNNGQSVYVVLERGRAAGQ